MNLMICWSLRRYAYSISISQRKTRRIMATYNWAYKTHYARIKYKKMTREEFQAWGEQARDSAMM